MRVRFGARETRYSPSANSLRPDQSQLSHEYEMGWLDHETLKSDDWCKWSHAQNLARILMAKNIAVDVQLIETPYESR